MPLVQKIFYGPPGTGKTYKAAREAVRAVSPAEYEWTLTQTDPAAAFSQLHKRLVDEGRIVWVTFHPSYSYEDFVEGYRPVTKSDPLVYGVMDGPATKSGQLVYEVMDGPFKQLCARANTGTGYIQLGEKLRDARGEEAGEVVGIDGGGWLVRTKPARSDEVASEIFKYVSKAILQRFIDAGLPDSVFSIPGSALVELKDFGLSPTDKDVPAPDASKKETIDKRYGNYVRRIVGGRAKVSSTDLGNWAPYGGVYRRLKELKGVPSPVAMVIDEMNRADLSRVFGELLTLLERDKRKGMPEERSVMLPYSKSMFTVPANVSVIGTMNTVDRSLTVMDFAMRRRFEFEFVDVEPERCPANYGGVDVQRVLKTINRRISVLLGNHYALGHAALMSRSLDEVAVRFDWQSLPDAGERSIAHVWRTYIIPTLLEYFHDDLQKARAVAGVVEADGTVFELFEEVRPDSALVKALPQEYDLVDSRAVLPAVWWDPRNSTWDASKFSGFLKALAHEA
jgi:5-methylcytosine-specific restriction protein B